VKNRFQILLFKCNLYRYTVFHLQVRLNGGYYGLFSFVEQVDAAFLKRQGLDPKGGAVQLECSLPIHSLNNKRLVSTLEPIK
jgi:hypothetical protein